MAVVVVVLFLMLLFTLITGFLSLVIPMLPVLGLIAVIMWFVGGPPQAEKLASELLFHANCRDVIKS